MRDPGLRSAASLLPRKTSGQRNGRAGVPRTGAPRTSGPTLLSTGTSAWTRECSSIRGAADGYLRVAKRAQAQWGETLEWMDTDKDRPRYGVGGASRWRRQRSQPKQCQLACPTDTRSLEVKPGQKRVPYVMARPRARTPARARTPCPSAAWCRRPCHGRTRTRTGSPRSPSRRAASAPVDRGHEHHRL